MKKNPLYKQIPNFITALNLTAGALSAVLAFEDRIIEAVIGVFICAVLDFFDGFAARILKAKSELGKNLDSLSDLISFGMAPSAILYKIQTAAVINLQDRSFILEESSVLYRILVYLPFLITLFSAIRLARFNTEQEEAHGFTGFSVTPNAIMISAASAWILTHGDNVIARHFMNPYIIGGWVILISFLLVSRLRMFSLKVKNLRFKENLPQYIFVFLTIILITVFRLAGIALSIVTYIIICLLMNLIPVPESDASDTESSTKK